MMGKLTAYSLLDSGVVKTHNLNVRYIYMQTIVILF